MTDGGTLLTDTTHAAGSSRWTTGQRRLRPTIDHSDQLSVVPARAFTTERLLTWDILPAPVGIQPGVGPPSALTIVDTLLRVGDHQGAVERVNALLDDPPACGRQQVALLARLAIAHQAQGADASAVSAVALADRIARRAFDHEADLEAMALLARVAAALTLHDVACRLFDDIAAHPDASRLLPRIAVHRALTHLHRALLLDLHGHGRLDWTITRALAETVLSDTTASPSRRGAAAALVSVTAHRQRATDGDTGWVEPLIPGMIGLLDLAARDEAHRALGRNALVLRAVGDGDLEAATKAITRVRREGHASVLPLLEAHVRDALAELLSAHGLGYTASAERHTARGLRRDADWAARTARATWLSVASAPLVTSI